MTQINSSKLLREAILELERKRDLERKTLKEKFELVNESFKPINFIKSTFKDATASQDFKNGLLNAAVAIATDYFSEKLDKRTTDAPFKRVLGGALLVGIKNAVVKNPNVISAIANGIFAIIQQRRAKRGERPT
jgi:hypothetical protein